MDGYFSGVSRFVTRGERHLAQGHLGRVQSEWDPRPFPSESTYITGDGFNRDRTGPGIFQRDRFEIEACPPSLWAEIEARWSPLQLGVSPCGTIVRTGIVGVQ